MIKVFLNWQDGFRIRLLHIQAYINVGWVEPVLCEQCEGLMSACRAVKYIPLLTISKVKPEANPRGSRI